MMQRKVDYKTATKLLNERCYSFADRGGRAKKVEPREVLAPGEEILLDTGAKLYRSNTQTRRHRYWVWGYAHDGGDITRLGLRLL